MARRRNLKEPEPVESAAEPGYVSPPKKRKVQQNPANDKTDDGKETNAKAARLPRAAKTSKAEQQIDVETEPVKKSRTTGKAAQSKKIAASSAELSAKYQKSPPAKAKRARNVKNDVDENVADAENIAETAAKKTRGKPPKKAGTNAVEKNDGKPTKAAKKNSAKENVEKADEPVKKKGRTKKETKPKEKVAKLKDETQGNAPQKKAPKSKAKAVASIDTDEQDDEDKTETLVEEENQETDDTEKVVSVPATKAQGKKKVKMAVDSVVVEEEEAKVSKGRQGKTAKARQNDKPPAKKARGKKQTANAEKGEINADLSGKDVPNEKRDTESKGSTESESDTENADATKSLSPSGKSKEGEKAANDASAE